MHKPIRSGGFSLIEVVIVLAISSMLLALVVGIYSIRRSTANDDAAQQIVSSIQTVRNDAQKGLGPTDINTIQPGETFFGEAIGFNNDNCQPGSTYSCLYVFKLVENPVGFAGRSGPTPRPYETSVIKLPQNFAFNLINTGDCSTSFITCYQAPGTSVYKPLSESPISSNVSGLPIGIVVRNSSGAMYVFKGGSLTEAFDLSSQYTANRQGMLRLAVAQMLNRNELLNQSAWQKAEQKYYIYIDLSGSNQIKVQRAE